LQLVPDIIEFHGSTMVDCPEILYSGADLIVSLSVYLRGSAFKFRRTCGDEDSAQAMFNEGQETMDEQVLRERKSSLLRLFDAIGLQPRNGVRRDQEGLTDSTESAVPVPKRQKTVRTEIVGDGEEIEVDDGEELTENELNVIYKK
jgi:DNA repair protein RAD5